MNLESYIEGYEAVYAEIYEAMGSSTQSRQESKVLRKASGQLQKCVRCRNHRKNYHFSLD